MMFGIFSYLFGDTGSIMLFILMFAALCLIIYNTVKKKHQKISDGLIASFMGLHVAGLPRSEGHKIYLDAYDKSIVFTIGKNKNALKIEIPKDQIKAIASKTESEVIGSVERGYTTGGLGLAMIGGLVLGPVGMLTGAIVGRRRSNS